MNVSYAACKRDFMGVMQCGAGACKINSQGQVHCSKFKKGGAAVGKQGKVFCGPGKCLKDKSGQVFCASSIQDDIIINAVGKARCDKKCVLGQVQACKTEAQLPEQVKELIKEQPAQQGEHYQRLQRVK
ncbi:hypothetical protein C2869_18865 [Saccharobesus litoralis]|uniref:Uncharacterized protein n=2 Tax=Saccharobesus litoralis TaxID=2172099 RepID=A0A2S0VVY7_9ALTE|nr:hypothetical protein C2869_18865 [Saccharobesus litoralis]